MEKRLFPLFCGDDWLQIGGRVFYVVLVALFLGLAKHTRAEGLIVLGFLVLGVALLIWEYRVLQSQTLEISDEGLTISSKPGKPVHVAWDAIGKCQISAAGKWTDRPFTAVTLTYSRWRGLRIWGSCPQAAQILDILKQHLPESVFVTR